MSIDWEKLAIEVRGGSRRALAQAISGIENASVEEASRAEHIARHTQPINQQPQAVAPGERSTGTPEQQFLVLGITGAAGAGKSTLVAALVEYLRQQGVRVAVLASDPSSPVTGGALLGDRLRVAHDPLDVGFFFRSLATRGAVGGLSVAAGRALSWLRLFGSQVVLIETVGAGQDQVAVRDIVDCLTVVVTPATGDEIQWQKAGVLELADVVVLNKADLPGADRMASELAQMLGLSPHTAAIPVVPTAALAPQGIAEWWRAVRSAADRAEPTG